MFCTSIRIRIDTDCIGNFKCVVGNSILYHHVCTLVQMFHQKCGSIFVSVQISIVSRTWLPLSKAMHRLERHIGVRRLCTVRPHPVCRLQTLSWSGQIIELFLQLFQFFCTYRPDYFRVSSVNFRPHFVASVDCSASVIAACLGAAWAMWHVLFFADSLFLCDIPFSLRIKLRID